MAGQPLSPRPASWPRLAGPRQGAAPAILWRWLSLLVFHKGTYYSTTTLLLYSARYYIDELGELHDETFTDKLEEQVNKQ